MGYAALAFSEAADAPYGSGTKRSGSGMEGFGSAAERFGPAAPVPPGSGPREAPREAPGEAPGEAPVAAPTEPDPDLLEDLGDEIATLAAHIHAATGRFLTLIARFDRLKGWEAGGHRSCAHWLSFRTGLDLGTAREHVRVARALVRLPETSAAMARGALSFSQVRALTRVAEPATEAELLELAEGATTAQLERMVRAWKKGSRKDETAWERTRHRSRKLSVFSDEDGMYVLHGRLTPEVGALVMRAIEAASDALYRERRAARPVGDPVAGGDSGAARDGDPGAASDPGAAYDTEREAARRRADALGLLAERALAAGFGGAERGCGKDGEAGAGAAEPACACGRRKAGAPLSGTRAERYQVVLHVEPRTLAADGEPGRSELEDGTRVSAETSRRLACDASLLRVAHAPEGSILDVGRRTRTIPPALRRALEARDRGCRFPGCGLRFTDAHHVVHWADGGETSLENVLLLCRHHHRLLHEDGWQVESWGKGRVAFRDPRGQVHFEAGWKAPKLPGDPVAALVRENRLTGADPDPYTTSARWKRERDIPDDVYFRATEAGL